VVVYTAAISACKEGKRLNEAWEIFHEVRCLENVPCLVTHHILACSIDKVLFAVFVFSVLDEKCRRRAKLVHV
jgi:pentatricopeptide repeat protein